MSYKTEQWKVIKLNKRENKELCNENILREISDSIKYNSIQSRGIPEEEERERQRERSRLLSGSPMWDSIPDSGITS